MRLSKFGWMVFAVPFGLAGQPTVSRNVSDGLTPPSVAPGAPPGVKEISGLERINLYNGSLSVVVPLLTIGGRGEAGYSMVARVSAAPWTVNLDSVQGQAGYQHTAAATNREQWPFEAPYSPGVVYAKRTGASQVFCGSSGDWRFSIVYTHVVFEEPDGTQIPLWDGRGHAGGCNGGINRGTRFESQGDAKVVFFANSPVIDSVTVSDPEKFAVSGTLQFPNGVKYLVDAGRIMKITDRNGNYVSLMYFGFYLTNVTDSAGRTTTIENDVYDGSQYIDRITYKGTGGAARTIRIKRVRFGTLPIRQGLSTGPPSFTNIATAQSMFDRLLTHIWLPDDRAYTFQYTRYGELARMALPSGAAIEYDHGAGVSNAGLIAGAYADGQVLDDPVFSINSDPGWRPSVYRRLLERRTYPTGNAPPEATTTYSRRESVSAPNTSGGKVTALTVSLAGYLEETTSGATLPASVVRRHYFHETENSPNPSETNFGSKSPLQNMLQAVPGLMPRLPSNDNPFEGIEYRTETPGLEKVERGYSMVNQTSSPMRRTTRLCQETTTLLNGANSRRKEQYFRYDLQGNPTETYENARRVSTGLRHLAWEFSD
ncbi:MAG: hypothetical protein JNL98_40710 [Bryobacterales bacterium]|nr:hypothetical protein [Bryobacterales bacterium]